MANQDQHRHVRNRAIPLIILALVLLIGAGFAPLLQRAQRFEYIIVKKLLVLNDTYFRGDFEQTGDQTITGNFTVTGDTTLGDASADTTTISGDLAVDTDIEHFGLPSVITTTLPYSPATGIIATIGDGELWLVHKVFYRVDTNFDCTGDDCTVTVGDDLDEDGFITATDAELQTTFTEATGYPAGYYGIENGSNGAYTVDDGGPFVYAPSGASQTIDYAVGGTDPAAGSATAFVIYTRVQ